ncbi:MAG: transposase [Desulfovibrio sp.]|nr:transposase [Desulfovibrio sp.]
MSDYHHGVRSVFAIHPHLVWITKCRKPILVGDIAFKTREMICEICRAESVDIIKGHISKDHIHLQMGMQVPYRLDTKIA